MSIISKMNSLCESKSTHYAENGFIEKSIISAAWQFVFYQVLCVVPATEL